MRPSSNSGSPAHPRPVSSAVPSEAIVEPITWYHWLVVFFASCGWLFDCMGQRIFVLSREPALRELLGAVASDGEVKYWGGIATLLMMVGWATGGILFGMMSDRYGRVKAMVSTLLAYTIFSGLSGFSRSGIEFLIYRFLFGLGVGGMFGAATTLVAESVPKHFRTMALGSMQALSAFGNMLASGLSLKITPGMENFWGHYSGWQVLSFVSVFPALLAVPMVLLLKEPQVWIKAKAEAAGGGTAKRVGSFADLFQHPRWRKSTLVGICLGVAGMVGLWGIAFFSPELITTAFKNRPLQIEEILKPAEVCAALKSPPSPAVIHLKAKLSPEVVRLVEDCGSEKDIPAATVQALVTDLNRLIQEDDLHDETAFQSVELKKRTRNLIQRVQKNGERQNIISLNRQLVEHLFPSAIRELQRTIDRTISRGTLLQDVGALLGMFAFTFAATYFNRRTAFLAAFVLCLCSVSYVFYALKTATDVLWMLPLIGFATLSCFAGYSIYFPEIFPTRLRGTGVGFCYNTVRYLAAPFPFLLGWLSTLMPFRSVAMIMSSIYLVGIVALIWAPETKGQPLPED
ncbi:MAG TPA: MFS transporter [Verrucomicrobiota bacterium]|jgi:MFS family permease|nr:MFS transporter [Verrucomicrobiota bacterium]HPI65390.1 MFS transporter [Verrucomicrobiota bacterium]HPV93198.1 MFS transporter [Verrucomicrobiota bacterium]